LLRSPPTNSRPVSRTEVHRPKQLLHAGSSRSRDSAVAVPALVSLNSRSMDPIASSSKLSAWCCGSLTDRTYPAQHERNLDGPRNGDSYGGLWTPSAKRSPWSHLCIADYRVSPSVSASLAGMAVTSSVRRNRWRPA
jgi:hypothetical protein